MNIRQDLTDLFQWVRIERGMENAQDRRELFPNPDEANAPENAQDEAESSNDGIPRRR